MTVDWVTTGCKYYPDSIFTFKSPSCSMIYSKHMSILFYKVKLTYLHTKISKECQDSVSDIVSVMPMLNCPIWQITLRFPITWRRRKKQTFLAPDFYKMLGVTTVSNMCGLKDYCKPYSCVLWTEPINTHWTLILTSALLYVMKSCKYNRHWCPRVICLVFRDIKI